MMEMAATEVRIGVMTLAPGLCNMQIQIMQFFKMDDLNVSGLFSWPCCYIAMCRTHPRVRVMSSFVVAMHNAFLVRLNCCHPSSSLTHKECKKSPRATGIQ